MGLNFPFIISTSLLCNTLGTLLWELSLPCSVLGSPWCSSVWCEGSTRLLSCPGQCPLSQGQARAALSTRAGSAFPWRQFTAPKDFPLFCRAWSCMQQLLQGGASSWEHLPAVPTAGTRCWQSSSCQLWVGKVSWECLTKLKGKVLYKKTQPPCVLHQ